MKLSEYKGEEALDVLADCIEPTIEIMQDKAVAEALSAKEILKASKIMLKEHKGAVIEIFAALEKKPAEEYKKNINLLTLPIALVNFLNDPELMAFFSLQGQTEGASSSISASGSTEGLKK